MKAWGLTEYAFSPSALRRALSIATLNAVSAAAIECHGLPEVILQKNLDVLDAAAVTPDGQLVMVGAFVPFIKRLKGRVSALKVIDKNSEALKPDEQVLWVLPQHVAKILSNASLLAFSGSFRWKVELELLLASERARIRVMAGR
jgi:uncharacterized protein